MKNIKSFCLKIFNSVINFSVYLNRHVFVMNSQANSVDPAETAHNKPSH